MEQYLLHPFRIIIIVILLSFHSCKKDKLVNEKSVLIGSWKWVSTSHTYGWCEGESHYNNIGPGDIGDDYAISFAENGKIAFFKNEIKEQKYRILFQSYSHLEDSKYAFQLKLNNDVTKMIEGTVSQDTMTIKYPYVEEDPNCENYLNFFVRE